MNKRTAFIATTISLLVASVSFAGETELGEVALRQAIRDCGTDLRLMCVAAHPDDEDDATLAMYGKKFGYHTIAVIATRGEGGQNEIGPELYNALGVIRTQEMTRASSITGSELHFLDLPEFGFSKTPEEAFAVWGREETVRRMVRVIRQTQPDVIITNHGTLKDHGHHQAVGIAIQEAFDAAGDPAKFPELAKEGLAPWQPQALYLRVWQPPTVPVVNVDFNELDPLRGKTYAEIAAQALQEHKSQGMGFFIDRYLTGTANAVYTLAKSHPGEPGQVPAPGGVLFEKLPDRVAAADWREGAQTQSGDALQTALVAADGKAFAGRDSSIPAKRQWQRLNRATALAMGLQLAGDVGDTMLVPGQIVTVKATLKDFGAADATTVTFSLEPAPWFASPAVEKKTAEQMNPRGTSAVLVLTIPANAPITVPNPEHLFDPHFMEPQVTLVAEVTTSKSSSPIELRVPLAIDIAPPVQLEFMNAPYLTRRNVDKTATIDVLLTNRTAGAKKGTLKLSVAPGLEFPAEPVNFEFAAENEQKVFSLTAKVGEQLQPRDYFINAATDGDVINHFSAVRMVDLALPEKIRVGVVQSYDNTFVKTLERLGIPHEALTVSDFTPARLDTFTTIIVDIRAYLVRPDLTANNKALLEYTGRGGNVVVMYQKTEEWRPEFAPYPIQISRNRVTVETAPVTILKADHPLFTTPNAIQPEDWDGWIQERGLYFPDRWDEHYTALLACADPGETIPPGSCLFTTFGKGTYLYTSLGWYRQLRELHPGALRVFANMLALHGAPQ